MKITLADMHCDTPYELYKNNQPLAANNLHISLEGAACYENYLQIAAVWSDKILDDDAAYDEFFRITDYFKSQIAANSDKAALCGSFAEIRAAWDSGRAAFVLAAEDARLLGGQIGRLDDLYAAGVRFLTFCWRGAGCIGTSHDCPPGSGGLTAFGREVLDRCLETGIIPDISHASDATAAEIIAAARAAGKPVAATHSNARAVHNHTRNLTDEQFRAVAESGGMVGINMYYNHLGCKKSAGGIEGAARHIAHYLSLGGAGAVCLGCDMDGADLPGDIAGVSDLRRLADKLIEAGYSRETVDGIFWRNAYEFMEKYL